MSFKSPLLIVFLFFSIISGIFAQQQFTGTIVDSQTKEPLFGAYVFIKNQDGETLQSSYTDFDGKFKINRPIIKEFLLELSFIGYQTFQQK